MKDFVKYISKHKDYNLSIQAIIMKYYLSETRRIISENTNDLSVFHFSSTRLLKEIDGISYYLVHDIFDRKMAIINSKGEITAPFDNYDYIDITDDNLIQYFLNAESGLIRLDGEIIKKQIEKECESVLKDSDNESANKISQEIITELKELENTNLYSGELKEFEEKRRKNLQTVMENTKLLEKSPYACLLTNNKYSETRFFTDERNKRFFVLKDKETEKCALINAKGELVSEFIYDGIWGFTMGEGHYILVDNNRKNGLIDCSGCVIAAPVYDNIVSFHEGLADVEQNKKWGYINSTGEIVIPLIYDSAYSFSFGKAEVKLNGETFYINRNGERI